MNCLIKFTPAQEEEGRWLGVSGGTNQQERQSALSGKEAKEFYQSLIQEGGAAGESRREPRRTNNTVRERRRQREPPRTTVASERDGHKLLRCAQEGDLPGLKELLEKKGCDINFKDDYFWTAIMCASYAGQRGTVRFLLQKGAAWVGVVDTQGRDARDLADQAGHTDVVTELDGYGLQPETPSATDSGASSQPQWCSVCGTHYSESEDQHQSSTLHQFSLRRPPPTPHYCLPPSSASFRMMVREGWDPGAGLGPKGEGRKQPVRTVLKRDQGGLGYGPAPRARVTHFKAKDTQAVKQAPRGRVERGVTLGRRAERRKEVKDRNWERDFRTSFNL
ncbi:G patch domain and ankyrin repeat-containing protein 1 [Megalops cyprinoides]|uniref:G patch domain and ankyrin repeat-containing protein 1 n=1 Tax=Megalops cyprinoides TaxID=118141 RepID=UPI001864BF4F|nr:G patch domain and ankyrin repeat-containing protein 1 [Megalops cyprinoides]